MAIAGARNGAFSGLVVRHYEVVMLRAAEAIKSLKVEPGELKHADGQAALL